MSVVGTHLTVSPCLAVTRPPDGTGQIEGGTRTLSCCRASSSPESVCSWHTNSPLSPT